MKYYKKQYNQSSLKEGTPKSLSDLPFEERNSHYVARKQSNLAILEAETSPDFRPNINPGKGGEQTGSSRLAKLHADQVMYEERRQMRALKQIEKDKQLTPFRPQINRSKSPLKTVTVEPPN